MATSKDTPNDNGLKIGPKVEYEIRERIKFLENRIAGYRKHGRASGRDEAELGRLRDFLQSLGLALVISLAVSCASPPVRAADLERSERGETIPLLESRPPAGPTCRAHLP